MIGFVPQDGRSGAASAYGWWFRLVVESGDLEGRGVANRPLPGHPSTMDALPLFPDLVPDVPDPAVDRAARKAFGGPVCGVDEAGRGPWAGPVVVAAVTFHGRRPPEGLGDSKVLSAEAREMLFGAIMAVADVSVVLASPGRIDAMNIRGATLWAMARAVAGLADRPAGALIDGRDVPPGLSCEGRALVSGDARSPSIAAASIVAKVTRDRLMTALAASTPGYGFERHKGYGTAEHAAALASLGVCVHHRRSFEPVRARLALG